jgi:hypothetical protein
MYIEHGHALNGMQLLKFEYEQLVPTDTSAAPPGQPWNTVLQRLSCVTRAQLLEGLGRWPLITRARVINCKPPLPRTPWQSPFPVVFTSSQQAVDQPWIRSPNGSLGAPARSSCSFLLQGGFAPPASAWAHSFRCVWASSRAPASARQQRGAFAAFARARAPCGPGFRDTWRAVNFLCLQASGHHAPLPGRVSV